MRNCSTKSARKSLKGAFSNVMAIDPAEAIYVQANPGMHRKSLKKLSHQLSIKFANALSRKSYIVDEKRSS
jgi:hypothetical protein